MRDGRVKGSSLIGETGQAASSLIPDVDGMHIHIFESSQLEGSQVGDLLFFHSTLIFYKSISFHWLTILTF